MVDFVFPINKIYSGQRRVCPDFEKLYKKLIYNNASQKFISLSDLGSLRQKFLPEITFLNRLPSSVVFDKINNFDFFRKMLFSIGRNCLPEAKLGEYVVHMIDNPPKIGFSRKSIFKIFRKTAANFENFDIFLVS